MDVGIVPLRYDLGYLLPATSKKRACSRTDISVGAVPYRLELEAYKYVVESLVYIQIWHRWYNHDLILDVDVEVPMTLVKFQDARLKKFIDWRCQPGEIGTYIKGTDKFSQSVSIVTNNKRTCV